MDGVCNSQTNDSATAKHTSNQVVLHSGGKSFATGLWSVLILTTVVLFSRRLAGALVLDLSLAAVACVSIIAACLSLLAYVLHLSNQSRELSFFSQICMSLVTLLVPMALAIVLAAEVTATLLTLLAILLAFSALALLSVPTGVSVVTGPSIINEAVAQAEIQVEVSELDLELDEELEPGVEIDLDLEKRLAAFQSAEPVENQEEHVTQWMKRFVQEECDWIEGAIPVEFEPGQKQAHVHLTFWPPFSAAPKLDCRLDHDQAIRFKISALHAYGARIEVKRSTDLDSQMIVELSFEASALLRKNDAA